MPQRRRELTNLVVHAGVKKNPLGGVVLPASMCAEMPMLR
jgi:hypothetical protein